MGGTLAWFGSEVADGGDGARGVEMPFDEEAVRGHATVEGTGGDAIEIGDVAAADGAEAIDIEMGIFGFEGIEGPLDETNAAAECVFALKEFELAADAAIAVGRKHGGHVRVEIGNVAVQTDEGFGETDQKRVAIECAENLAAGVIGDDESDVGLGVESAVGPDLTGDTATQRWNSSREWSGRTVMSVDMGVIRIS